MKNYLFFLSVLTGSFFNSYVAATPLENVGYRNELYSFETVTQALSQEIEKDYQLFIFINTAEGPTPQGAFIPNQHMLVVEKAPDMEHIFKRNHAGTIKGIQPGALGLSQIISSRSLEKAIDQSIGHEGLPFDWDGREVLPISTGTLFNMATFSGVFQLNWQRSLDFYKSDPREPMSYSLYLGYFYHDKSVPRDNWVADTREKVSYVAIHGTPKENWHLLGRSRASHGCARALPPIMKGLYQRVDQLPYKRVIELDWDYALPSERPMESKTRAKPVLVILFDRYLEKSI
ncbi:MAG: L,D-transpeptidase [Pseudomonadota bacterium]